MMGGRRDGYELIAQLGTFILLLRTMGAREDVRRAGSGNSMRFASEELLCRRKCQGKDFLCLDASYHLFPSPSQQSHSLSGQVAGDSGFKFLL